MTPSSNAFTKTLIRLVRQTVPELFAKEICSVQPMNFDLNPLFWAVEEAGKSVYFNPKQGERMHDFARGWLRFYGTEWIPEHVYFKIKLKGL